MTERSSQLSLEIQEAVDSLKRLLDSCSDETRVEVGCALGLGGERDGAVLDHLISCVSRLERLVGNTWRTISPSPHDDRRVDLESTVRGFLAGEAGVSEADVELEIERVRQMTAALIAAIGQCGRQFAQRHQSRFSPDSIRAAVRLEKGWLESQESAAWRKYVALASEYDELAIETEIRGAVVAYVESMLGPGGMTTTVLGDTTSGG